MEFELNVYGGIVDIGIGDEIGVDKLLSIDFSSQFDNYSDYLTLEQVKQLHNHLGLVIDKYENDGVTIYDRVESRLAIEEAKGGYIGTRISSSEIARVIDTYKKLGGILVID